MAIEAIDEQFIPIGTKNYELVIGITGQNLDVRVDGLQEGFYQTFETLDNGNSQVKIKADVVARLISEAVWRVNVRDLGDDTTEFSEITYNVVPVGPVLIDPGRQIIYKGVPLTSRVEVRNEASVQRTESELVGLKSESVTDDAERTYIESKGMLPLDVNLTFDSFKTEYYVENDGGSDNLSVIFDIRDAPPTNIRDGSVTRVGNILISGFSNVFPRGFAIAPDGTAYMLITATRVGANVNALYTLDLATGTPTQVGTAIGFGLNLRQPWGLAIAPDGTAYILDQGADALFTLDLSTGIAIRMGSATRFGVNENQPVGFAIAPDGTAYMLGDSTNALYTLNLATGEGTRVGSETNFGVGESLPRGLAIDLRGNAYMLGSSMDRIYSLNLTTGRASRVGSVSRFRANVSNPEGLAIVPDGTVYMTDNPSARGVLYRFNRS